MTTTTIRIDEDLKSRITAAAARAGMSAHGFILDAIERTVESAEMNDRFHHVADRRWEQSLGEGKAIAAEDMHAYLQARARGEPVRRPRPRKPSR